MAQSVKNKFIDCAFLCWQYDFVILFDEPTSALAPELIGDVFYNTKEERTRQFLARINREVEYNI